MEKQRSNPKNQQQVAASTEAPCANKGTVAASSEAPEPKATTTNAPATDVAGEQQWQQVSKRKRTPSDMRKKQKRAALRADKQAADRDGRQPAVAGQPTKAPAADVSAKQPQRPGESQGGAPQRADKGARPAPGAKEKSNATEKARRKRGGRGKKGKAAPDKQTGTGPVPKRPRPDDTLSPKTSFPKRTKTSTGSGVVRKAVSYADTVVLNDLYVAVMTEPFKDLTPEQVEELKLTLETSIVDLVGTPSSSPHALHWPSFRGKPFHSEGVLKLQCESKRDVEWLKDTIATCVSPIPDTKLVVKRQIDIPRRVKSAVLLPSCSEDVRTIQILLRRQNPWYQVSSWSLYNVERHEGTTSGAFLVLGIPADQIPGIIARERRLAYKLGNAYIRFFNSSGKLLDAPPPVETATATVVSGALSAAKQRECTAPNTEAGASVSEVSEPSSVERQSSTGEPAVPHPTSSASERAEGASACPLTTPREDADDSDLERDVAQLMDHDAPLESDEEMSIRDGSSTPN
ncbi:uncharacterized protein LOC125227508 [Leguminivora glycinivorella]|uniref:uncharacterized protein LOC125227508 n=1 Tax=Leguminivora glycinivorella TaxID=1035111 RepID=UPI00200CB278|nr:uncharacterized protein LOC125227508 [Leguminivora glycinivorella]